MATIITRSGKGSPLTNTEVDNNFTNLNNDKAELSGADFTGDLGVTGNVSVTGTVDGRDVASDGTKLDAIEALADVTDTTNVVSALTAGTNITIAADGTISSTDTNTQLTDEQVQDIVGAMLSGNTESGITVTYQDADGTIDFTVSSQTDENFTSALKTKLDGIESGADVTDTTNVVASLTAGSNVTIAADGTISSTDTNTQLTTEQVQDIVGAMFSGNTETRIAATYQDADGTIDLVVDNMNQSVGDATITISAGTSLSGGGDFTTNQSSNETITINHADTSSQASVNNSGNTVIQDVTLDTHGHVTGLTSKALSIPSAANNATITISAGTDLTGGGNFTTNQGTAETITINHEDVSSQASVNNSGGTVIQDVTLNANGHVTALGSVNLDGRYFTESEADARYLRLTGGGMSGDIDMNTNDITEIRSLVLANTEGSDHGTVSGTLMFDENFSIDTEYGTAWSGGNGGGIAIYNEDGWGRVLTDVNAQWHTATFDGLNIGSNSVFHDGYHPNADKWTTARTLSLTGDVTGSASVDGSVNASISSTLATPTDAPQSWQDVVAWNSGLIKDAAVEIHGAGYLRASYLNMTHGVGTRSSDTVFYSSTDDYIRKTNATGMRSSLDVPTRTGGDASGTWGISITGDAGTVDGLNAASFIRSDATDNVSGHTEWQDNYQVRFGNGADFRIYHNGTDTYLRNYNHSAGNIYFQGENTSVTNQALIYMQNNTARTYVRLFENGSERLKTTSTGIDVTGVITTDGITTSTGIDVTGDITSSGAVNVGDGTAQSKITIKKADNNISDHIEFYNGTTRIGEIGCEDNSWLRINQETNINIYTPRYIRADNGFRVDGTALGIQGDGSSVIPVGSAGTPSLRFNGDTNTGVFQNGADAVGISAGGTRRASFGTTIYLESDDVRINRYLYHNGDTNTYMRMDADRIAFVAGAVEFIDMTEGSDDNIDFNTRARFNKGIREQSDTLSGTSVTINQNNATNFVHDLTGNTTYTFSNPAASGDSSSFTLKVIQDSTARTITWPTSVDWVGGSAPTLSSANGAVDVFVFFTHDGGTTYYGFVAGQDLK